MKHTILFFVFVILSTNCQQQKTISIQKGTTTQSNTTIVMSIDSTVVAKANTPLNLKLNSQKMIAY